MYKAARGDEAEEGSFYIALLARESVRFEYLPIGRDHH